MKKKVCLLFPIIFVALFFFATSTEARTNSSLYRLYNPHSGEHFYTDSWGEVTNLKKAGWTYEGLGWYIRSSGGAVYRLYNPNSGDHHYTLSASERDSLVRVGWRNEGIAFYSGGQHPIYREYNPNAETGTHNYTDSLDEHNHLVRLGWKDEGIAFYAPDRVEADDKGPIASLASYLGKYLGYSQCYAVSSFYAKQLGGPGLGAGIGSISDVIGDTISAANIGSGYNWAKYGWTVVNNPSYSQIRPGDIINWKGNSLYSTASSYRVSSYGHTGVVGQVLGGNRIAYYTQNPGALGYQTLTLYMSSISSVIHPPTEKVNAIGL